MADIYMRQVGYIPEISYIYAYNKVNIFLRYSYNKPEICQSYVLDIFKIYLRNTQYTPELKYACNMPEIWQRYG